MDIEGQASPPTPDGVDLPLPPGLGADGADNEEGSVGGVGGGGGLGGDGEDGVGSARRAASPAPSAAGSSAHSVMFETGAHRRKQREGAADERTVSKTLRRLTLKAFKMRWHVLAIYVSTETGRVITGTTDPCLPSLHNLEVFARAALRMPGLAAVLFRDLEAENGRWPVRALEQSRQNMNAAALLLKGQDLKVVLAGEKAALAEARKQKEEEEEDEAKAAEAAAGTTAAPVATSASARLTFVREYRERVSGAERAAKAACAKAVKGRCTATATGVHEAQQVLRDYRKELDARTEACKAMLNTLSASRLSDADKQEAFVQFAGEAETFSTRDEKVFKVLGTFSPTPATPSAAGANLVRAFFGEVLAAEAERRKGASSPSASPQRPQGVKMDEEEGQEKKEDADTGAGAGASNDSDEEEAEAEAESEDEDEIEDDEDDEGEAMDSGVVQAVTKRNGVANTGTDCHTIALLQCLGNLPPRILGLYLVPEELAKFLAEVLQRFGRAAGSAAAVQTVSIFADILQKLNDGSPKTIGLAAFCYQWNLSQAFFINEADYFNSRQQDAPSVLLAVLERLACVMVGRSINVFRARSLIARAGDFDTAFRAQVRQQGEEIEINYRTPCPLTTSVAHVYCTITTCQVCRGKAVELNVQRILQVELPGDAGTAPSAVARASAAASSSRFAVVGSGVPVALQALINKSADEKPFNEGDDYDCRQCMRHKGGATRQYLIQTLPDVLVVQLLRYKTEKAIARGGARKGKAVAHIRKNKTPIGISLELDVSKLLSPLHSSDGGETLYYLAAFVTHIGDYGAGHYTATCRDAKGWRLCDDKEVTSTTLAKSELGNIYMLFYVRRGSDESAHAAAHKDADAAAIAAQAQAHAGAGAGEGPGEGAVEDAGEGPRT